MAIYRFTFNYLIDDRSKGIGASDADIERSVDFQRAGRPFYEADKVQEKGGLNLILQGRLCSG